MLGSGFYNMDCMDAMREFPDNFFELAVVDPPYGDGGGVGNAGAWSLSNRRNMGGEVLKKIISWDIAPEQEYFEELFRVSQNQIIWGGQLLQTPAKPMFSDMAQN